MKTGLFVDGQHILSGPSVLFFVWALAFVAFAIGVLAVRNAVRMNKKKHGEI